MPADLDFWHKRYTQQAGWTLEARRYIFNKIGVDKSEPILEVGSATGALLSSLYHNGYTQLTGLDIDFSALQNSKIDCSICADAHQLPFSPSTFSLVICHFLLLWVKNPLNVLQEMRRVSRPGSWVVALAEPDYTKRIDLPKELRELGAAQSESLATQGADIEIGAHLWDLFNEAGFSNIEIGVIQSQDPGLFTDEEFEMEWAVLHRDLAGHVPEKQIRRWYDLDRMAAIRGERQHYVPVHFAFGQKS